MSSARADLARLWRRSSRRLPATATGWIVGVTLVAYVVQLLSRGVLESLLAYVPDPVFTLVQPWRLLTAALIHQPVGAGISIVGLTHIGFNMYALYLFGRPLEGVIGAARLLVVYLLSVLAGSVAVLYFAILLPQSAPDVVYGASGGVFGVLGAVAVVQRRLGVDVRSLVVLIGINFALAFVLPRIAWQAHLGGLLVGGLVGWIFITNRGPRRGARARLAGAVVAVVLLGLAFAPALLG